MNKYEGSCHCGAVKFTFDLPEVKEVLQCNCSICSRKGIRMSTSTVPPDLIEISAQPNVLSTYQFASERAQHHFCSICGIHTFVETYLNPGHYRINLGCVENIDALHLPETVYDGKSL